MKIYVRLFILLLFLIISSISIVNAATDGSVVVVTSEKIPGANCIEITSLKNTNTETKIIKTLRYECNIGKGFGIITTTMGKIIKYFTFLAGLGGVLFIILNSIMYSMGGIDQTMKDEAKKRITATIMGLILLLISGVILKLVAPWVYV